MAVIEPKYYSFIEIILDSWLQRLIFLSCLVTKSLFSNFLGITPRQKNPSPTWISNMKTSLELGWTKI